MIFLNIVVQQPVYERFRPLLRQQPLLLITATVQRHDGVVNVVAREVARFPVPQGRAPGEGAIFRFFALFRGGTLSTGGSASDWKFGLRMHLVRNGG